jgi:NADH:ubiquinone oxidoreductase subunit 4 (subunit M)
VLEWRIRRILAFSSLHHGFINLQGCYVNLTDLKGGIIQTKRHGGRVVVMVNTVKVFDTVPHIIIYKLP